MRARHKGRIPETEFRIFGGITEPVYETQIRRLEREGILRYFGEVGT
jgi:hypothetical protein